MKKRAYTSMFLLLLFCLCKEEKLQILHGKLGKNLQPEGSIKETSLIYNFQKPDKIIKVKDLFNYIYFKGDTLCFSFEITKQVREKDVEAWFVNPITNKKYKAERIDVYKNRIYGFSLVGTILEQFLYSELNSKRPENSFCCTPIYFDVLINIKKSNISSRLKGSFKIFYN